MKSIILALMLAASPAHADPDRISILLGSHHFGTDLPWQQSNPGLFATWEGERLDWSLGAYRNSYDRLSVAATVALPIWARGQAEVSLFAGVALYPKDGRNFAVHLGDVVPIGGVQLRMGHVFAQVMPGDGQTVKAVVATGLTFELNRR